MMEPTPDDRARDLAADLAADLALCEAAQAGPWYDNVGSCDTDDMHSYHWMCVCSQPDDPADPIALGQKGYNAVPDGDMATFAMIAASRVGWPAAIRRALAAEAEVRNLRQLLRAVEAV